MKIAKQELMLPCDCYHRGHMVVVEWDEEWGVMISLQAGEWQGFFRRLLTAVKYVLGIGRIQWDSCIVRKEDIPGLVRLLEREKNKADVTSPPSSIYT